MLKLILADNICTVDILSLINAYFCCDTGLDTLRSFYVKPVYNAPKVFKFIVFLNTLGKLIKK